MRTAIIAATLVLAVLAAPQARADGFAALVSPPRFEVASKPGDKLRQVIELTNRSNTPGKYRMHTADFVLGADYGVNFHDELLPDSCRPWVAIERPAVTLPAGGTIHYRFEVQVPPDAQPTECRFAIMIEADEPSVTRTGLPSARPVRALPAASANIAAAVTAVQAIPSRLCPGRYPVARTMTD